ARSDDSRRSRHYQDVANWSGQTVKYSRRFSTIRGRSASESAAPFRAPSEELEAEFPFQTVEAGQAPGKRGQWALSAHSLECQQLLDLVSVHLSNRTERRCQENIARPIDHRFLVQNYFRPAIR